MKWTASDSVALPPCFHELMTVVHDMDMLTSPRTSLKMDLGHIQSPTCSLYYHWSTLQDSWPFLPMDFSKRVTHDASEDLRAMVLVQQTVLDKFRTWCQQVNVSTSFKSHHYRIFMTTWLLYLCHKLTVWLNARPYHLLLFSTIRPSCHWELWLGLAGC